MSRTRPRILFVDDEPIILRALARLLRPDARRWDMTFVHGGPAGMRAVAEDAFDVLVTDVDMPEVDGHALVAFARSLGRVCALYTGGTVDRLLVDVRVLVKPATSQELRQLVEECAAEIVRPGGSVLI